MFGRTENQEFIVYARRVNVFSIRKVAMKTHRGFTLPWAGVTLAPSVKVRNAKLRGARYFALRGGSFDGRQETNENA